MKKVILIIFIIFFFLGLIALINTNKERINDMDSLEIEKSTVESYVRENIKEIAINEEVLGGTWYVVSLEINTEDQTGFVIYEDGHIQSNADFSYEYNKKNKEVKIKDFNVLE